VGTIQTEELLDSPDVSIVVALAARVLAPDRVGVVAPGIAGGDRFLRHGRASDFDGEPFIGERCRDLLNQARQQRRTTGSAVCFRAILGIPDAAAADQYARAGEVPVHRHVAADRDG
jgi:hypothetical protein